MYKYLLPLLLLFSLNASASHQTGSDYHVDVSARIATAQAACDAEDADALLVTTDGAFSSANLNDTDYEYICVAPGVDGGKISITDSGAAGVPKVLLLDDGGTENPYNLLSANRATVDELHFDGGDYWIVDRMHVTGTSPQRIDISSANGSNDIHIQRSWIQGGGDGAGMLNLQGDNVVIQENVIEESETSADSADDHCLNITNSPDNITIVGNEINDCTGDLLQIHGGSSVTAIKIAYNEWYFTSALYTDCSGTINGTGNCIAAENWLDFKKGAGGSHPYDDTEKVLVIGNTFRGLGMSDDGAFVSGGGGEEGMIIHQTVEGIHFKDNYFNMGGISGSSPMVFSTPDTSSSVEQITYQNNLFHESTYAINGILNAGRLEMYNNTFLDVTNIFFGNEDTSDYMCNVLITVTDAGAATLGSGSAAHDNAFYAVTDKAPLFNSGDVDETLASAANNGTYSYKQFHITNPTTVNVSNAVTTASSPHYDTCDNPTETADYGVDNTDKLISTIAGFFISEAGAAETIVREGSSTWEASSTVTTVDVEHTIQSGTTLSILTITRRATIDTTESPSWNGTEDFTLIRDTGADQGDDTRTEIWGLVSPTATTADIDYTVDSNNYVVHTLVNYSGTETASVAAATNFLNEDINYHPLSTTTGVHASAGTSGATLFLAGGHSSNLSSPASNNVSFFEIADGVNTGTSSIGYYVADLIGGSPSAVTITWGALDQNASMLIEILPGEAASHTPRGSPFNSPFYRPFRGIFN